MTSATLTTTIDLLRHGEAEGGRIFRGRTNSLLTAHGFEQMTHTIGLNPPAWNGIISSPLRRCSDFAETLSLQYQTSLVLNDAFREIHFGDWEGQSVEQIYQQQPETVEQFWLNPVDNPPPGAEPMIDFQQRVAAAWVQLLAERRGEHVLLVTHGGVIRLILAELLGIPLQRVPRIAVPEAALSRIQVFHEADKPDWPQVVFLNGVYP